MSFIFYENRLFKSIFKSIFILISQKV